MQLVSTGFYALIHQTGTQNQLVLYWTGLVAKAAGQKPARRPRSREVLPLVSRFLHSDINASRTKTGWWFKTL
jgi:hypothetical protein